MIHDLKCWPSLWEAIADGRKTFEWRRDDRGFAVGDQLVLREWDPETQEYTRRHITVDVTYCLHGPVFGIPDGFALMSIRRSLRGWCFGPSPALADEPPEVDR